MKLPDWSTWAPQEVATLLFVRRGHQLLLIRKKRGLGAGKINAPGGRLEPGETPAQAAVREVEEEVCVRPLEARERGVLRFQFVDGYALRCHVFLADGCEGEPTETDEAAPLWVPVSAVPYEEMWADDALWLPRMLAGYTFDGRFVFDGDHMAWHALELGDPAAPLYAHLGALGVRYTVGEHAPVFTVEEAQRLRVEHEGIHVKNLFLRNKKGKMWLVTVPEAREVSIDALGEALGAGRLSFGSAARLREHLGVEPGSVTPLAARNDRQGLVTVAVDETVLDAPWVCCHPLTNDRTLGLRGTDLERFLRDTGHPPVRLRA